MKVCIVLCPIGLQTINRHLSITIFNTLGIVNYLIYILFLAIKHLLNETNSKISCCEEELSSIEKERVNLMSELALQMQTKVNKKILCIRNNNVIFKH